MALSHAILVSLLDRPLSGYEIGKRFEKTVGFFWKASHQQIYQQLHKMQSSGWVSGETIEQSERPNRIVYSITDVGTEVLDDWVAAPSDPPSQKEELLVKLFALGDADAKVLHAELQRRLQFHRDRLAEYESILTEFYPDPDKLSPRKTGRYLGLKMGILGEKFTIEWCEEAIERVAALVKLSQ